MRNKLMLGFGSNLIAGAVWLFQNVTVSFMFVVLAVLCLVTLSLLDEY